MSCYRILLGLGFKGRLVQVAVRLLNGLIAYLTVRYTLLVQRNVDPGLSGGVLWNILHSNWFILYALTRSYSNTFEALFVVLTVYFSSRRRTSLAAASAVVVLMGRYTGVIIAAPVLLFTSFDEVSKRYRRRPFSTSLLGLFLRYHTLEVLPPALLTFLFCHVLDCYLHGSPLLSPPPFWNNLNFNILGGKAELYGTHWFGWYFVEAGPAVMGTHTVGFLASLMMGNGGKEYRRSSSSAPPPSPNYYLSIGIKFGCVLYVALLSTQPHKELRFLLPILPFAMIESAKGWKRLAEGTQSNLIKFALPSLSALMNYCVVLYLGLFHQRLNTLSIESLAPFLNTAVPSTVHLLTECHWSPTNTHLPGYDVSFKILGCEPECRVDGSCESDQWSTEGLSYVTSNYEGSFFGSLIELPDFFLIKNHIAVDDWIKGKGYDKVWEGGSGEVRVWRRGQNF